MHEINILHYRGKDKETESETDLEFIAHNRERERERGSEGSEGWERPQEVKVSDRG